MRLAELALFLAPLGAYILWRMTMTRGRPGPSPVVLSGILTGLLLFGASLALFAVWDRETPGSHYVPAVWRDGQVVPGHAE